MFKSKKNLKVRAILTIMSMMISASWFVGCSPSGSSMTDMSENVESTSDMPVPQYPLSVNRTNEAADLANN